MTACPSCGSPLGSCARCKKGVAAAALKVVHGSNRMVNLCPECFAEHEAWLSGGGGEPTTTPPDDAPESRAES